MVLSPNAKVSGRKETMYYEEKVIDGVLCWRGTPDGKWERYTLEALTVALTAERSRAKDLEEVLFEHTRKILAVKVAIGD